jgi:hypothetical protein
MVDVTGYAIRQIIDREAVPYAGISSRQHRRRHTMQRILRRLRLWFAAPLQPFKTWLDQIEMQNVRQARWICQLIPAQCPFERDIVWRGRTIVRIPAMCKLNPFYEQFVFLRFRAVCYLADECGEDVRRYC